MRKFLVVLSSLLATILMLLGACTNNATKYKYETVAGDPLNARIYTLDNGLKVYLSVNSDRPRIQTYIGVRVGGKNDPAETTGLAHYFEHLMFKGTQKFGTSDYAAEKPLLDKIEELFEVYRKTADDDKRKALYAQIDSVSQEAAKLAIPNEYDKLMNSIGSQGTNAFTSYDVTAYVENIPANRIEDWLEVEADRFTNPVLRLFHTELETVYEEYNMSLTRDSRKVFDTILAALFPNHPYGKQTILGTQDHLKNPSITNIKNYFDTYYVPNNMAICMVGDLDPDKTIAVIDKYFGKLASKEVPKLKITPEQPITAPIIKEVVGLEAENIMLAYRLPGASSKDATILEFIDYLLTNGDAGLIDLNLVQKQKILSGGSSANSLSDYSIFVLMGTPKEGQSLDEVRNLLLGQIELLKKGEFEDWLLPAVINNLKLSKYYQQQESGYAAYLLLNTFINQIDWAEQVGVVDFLSKLTKQDVIDFCNKYFNDNYVAVYKKQGMPEQKKLDKPQITPIPTNRDNESAFLVEYKTRETTSIEPVFVDYNKDMSKLKAKSNVEILYKQNTTNPLFSINYVFEMGNNSDKLLGTAFNYLDYLGTSKHSAEEIKSEFYKMACSFSVSASNDRVYASISGLSDNFEKALELLEERLADAAVDANAWENMASDILKSRVNAKANQGANFSRLRSYGQWGPKSSVTNIPSAEELKSLDPQVLVDKIKSLKNYEHRILYYGPLTADRIVEIINQKHAVADKLQPVPEAIKFVEQETNENTIYLAHYDAKQIYFSMLSKGETGYNKAIEPDRQLYNSYFGGGMNSIVFQEMREARGLAYSAGASYSKPGKPERSYYMATMIATQTDKLADANAAFIDILNNMPESEKAFGLAKEGILSDIRTGRILRDDILWNYLGAIEFGYDYDSRKDVYEKVKDMTLANVKAFQEKYVKNRAYTYCILGDTKEMDMKFLNSLGKVRELTQEEIFGY
ncbi:MAG: insulinase family protein [Prevotellaceae bacterium]|jgi:predicted Zn-dependent peptidase|nr:insulinase family protein [Prevotellaceae bacterium]